MSTYNNIDSDSIAVDTEMTINEVMLTATSGTALSTIPESPCEEESDFDFDEPEMMDAFFNATATSSTQKYTRFKTATARSNHRLSLNLAFLSPTTANGNNKLVASSTSGASSPMSSSPPSATYSCLSFASSTASSVASSPGGIMGGGHGCSPAALSPILNPFQWTTDLRQYIITDIGPQPSNSRQIPALVRSHVQQQKEQSQQAQQLQSPMSPSPSHQMQRQRSNSRIQGVASTTMAAISGIGSGVSSSSFSNLKTLDSDRYLEDEEEDEDRSFSSKGFYARKFGVGMMDRFPILASKQVRSLMSEAAIQDSDMTVDQELSS